MNWKHFQGPDFTMKVPDDWSVIATPQFQVMFMAPEGQHGNLAISIRPVKEGVIVNAVAASARQEQQDQYPEYEVLQETLLAGRDGAKFQRAYRWFNKELGIAVNQRQIFQINSPILYTITTTRPEAVNSKTLNKTLERMTESFCLERKRYIKTQTVMELLREEKTLEELASESGIHPEQLRNWRQTVLNRLQDNEDRFIHIAETVDDTISE